MSYFSTQTESVYGGHLFLANEFGKEAKTVEFVGRNKRVLEIGCANGRMSTLLAAQGCRITGVELNPALAEMARSHCEEVIVGNIEEEGVLSPHELFDVALMADVIEHLAYPDRLLERLRGYLRPNGSIVIAVPNVVFLLNRVPLLFGRFNYSPTGGILDATHLRFFTAKTIRELVTASGYTIESFYPAPLLLRGERLSQFKWLRPILWSLNGYLPMTAARLLPGLLASSFVVKATR
jgi:2-polyprenyl-3-methyl-5-hydroxy-6-metoxy-1,4-benzoquinol methylase